MRGLRDRSSNFFGVAWKPIIIKRKCLPNIGSYI